MIARLVVLIAGFFGIGVVPFVAGFMALSIAGAGIYGLWKGYSWASAQCETASLKAEIAELKLELKTQKDADAEEASATAELAKEKAELEQKVSAYEDKLSKQPENACAVTDDDLSVMQ